MSCSRGVKASASRPLKGGKTSFTPEKGASPEENRKVSLVGSTGGNSTSFAVGGPPRDTGSMRSSSREKGVQSGGKRIPSCRIEPNHGTGGKQIAVSPPAGDQGGRVWRPAGSRLEGPGGPERRRDQRERLKHRRSRGRGREVNIRGSDKEKKITPNVRSDRRRGAESRGKRCRVRKEHRWRPSEG